MTDDPEPLSGATADADDATVIRAEEELRLYTRRRATRRARLVKTTETRTEIVTHSVPLRREQVEIEYAPFHDEIDQTESRPVGDRWLVLYEEQVVIQTRWVARERVRLAVRAVIENSEITEAVRKEQIALDDQSKER